MRPPRKEDKDDGPGVVLPYSKDMRVVGGAEGAAPPAIRCEGKLARISTARLDLDALESLDERGLLKGVLEVIRDPQAFRSQLLPGAVAYLQDSAKPRRSTSRNMLRHWPDLLEWGVMSRASKAQRVVLPAFTVEKKSGISGWCVMGASSTP